MHHAVRNAALVAVAAVLVGAAGAAAQGGRTELRQPRVQIGVADGDAAYLLFGAQQALRTRDGRIVIANTGSSDIRVYDSGGRHVRTLGRKGDGPGEFRALQRIGLIAGDSIAAYDIGNGRITVFTPEGGVARTSPVQPFGNTVLPRAFGFTRSGGMLVRTDFDRVFRAGPARDTVDFAMTDAVGVPLDTLGRYPAEEAFILSVDGFATRRSIAFGRDLHASARGDRLVIGTSDDFSFDVYFGSGTGRRTYRQTYTPRRATRAELERIDREWLETRPPQFRAGIEPHMGEFPHRDTYPAFAALLAGADGSIWVQHYPAPGSSQRAWTVFGADGRVQREVRSRLPLRIVDAGADYALAWLRDELDSERILLFDLAPPK